MILTDLSFNGHYFIIDSKKRRNERKNRGKTRRVEYSL